MKFAKICLSNCGDLHNVFNTGKVEQKDKMHNKIVELIFVEKITKVRIILWY